MQPEQAAALAASPIVPGPVKAAAATMAVVNTYINTAGGVQKASFTVDIEQIPGLIEKYKDAREKLRKILQKSYRLRSITPPGEDEISQQMANSLSKMATDEPGCLAEAVRDGIKRLTDQINQLEAALRDYRSTDEAATARQI
ncbi:hypothetical protein GU90_03215 [Saccharopolyspora rectivirgula]|jgi:hypothetical protein|uniref:PE domain-containing protein n=1 Tax=Saccharopolyspora rectivirgula TaxID=28042 RepID=A0A073B1N3_9PSEU|nr:hypothetical protein GU90_03215 [Saccharopolyspora rectivirgula]